MSELLFEKNLLQISGFKFIPDGWEAVQIVDIFEIGRGRVISQIEIDNHPGIYSVYSSQTYKNGEMGKIDTYDFNGEYLTWTTDGANAGTVFYRNGKFNCTNVCGTLKALRGTDSKYFLYHLSRISKRYVSYIGNPKLMNDVVANIAITRPTSLAEQRKIARILSTVDAVIEKTEAAIAKYKAIKAGMMRDLFTRGIDLKTGKLRPRYKDAPELYKESELGWVPREWEVVRIGAACTSFVNGGTPSTKNTDNWKGTIPWITGADFLESFEIGFIRRYITKDAVSNSSTHVINGGNILLVTRTGVGKLAIAPFDIAISQDITGLILNNEMFIVNYFFVYLQLLVEDFKKMNQGTSINGIVRNDLENTLVIQPNIDEQEKVAQKVLAIDRNLAMEIEVLQKHQQLKSALMSDLLTGKVRVKYNENEKPEAI